ncbi:MAG: restriction endonuclease, partial [Campylobacterota bacterium]|nr:restriction endonuclease [Campylobacterota bacterium]
MSKQPPLNSQHTYAISEYGLIGTDKSVENHNGYQSIQVPQKVFNELEAFAKSDYGSEVFRFHGNGRYLQAKSYVGTIQTKSGYTIEILPKIYNSDNEDKTKDIFIELLRMLYKLPKFKHIDKAHFEHEKMPLLEIFISMFLDEVGAILKKGIKSDYIANQDNLYYLKGKLLISEQIKQNTIHKERFYVEYDEYTPNRVENRLIKSTLNYLLKISNSFENIRLARMYQEHIYSVEYSRNYDADFRACKTHQRGMEHYRNALIWARVFLKRDSFSSFSGETIAFAILYPMERLFENYIEQRLREKYEEYQVIAQSHERDFVKGLFGIKP